MDWNTGYSPLRISRHKWQQKVSQGEVGREQSEHNIEQQSSFGIRIFVAMGVAKAINADKPWN